jgi:hypothetical protein
MLEETVRVQLSVRPPRVTGSKKEEEISARLWELGKKITWIYRRKTQEEHDQALRLADEVRKYHAEIFVIYGVRKKLSVEQWLGLICNLQEGIILWVIQEARKLSDVNCLGKACWMLSKVAYSLTNFFLSLFVSEFLYSFFRLS